MTQTIQQQRASFALGKVNLVIQNPNVNKKEFKSYVASLPFMIKTNGLGQAAAFYHSKGGTHDELYKLLSEWLVKEGKPFQGKKDLLEGITQSDMQTYLAAQAEAMAFLQWVKQFANALIEEAKEVVKNDSSS